MPVKFVNPSRCNGVYLVDIIVAMAAGKAFPAPFATVHDFVYVCTCSSLTSADKMFNPFSPVRLEDKVHSAEAGKNTRTPSC